MDNQQPKKEGRIMCRKVSFETYEKRFKVAHPNENVKIEGYAAISKPVTITCLVCGKKHFYKNGNRAITGFKCCSRDDKQKIEHIKEWLDKSSEFDFVSKTDNENIIIRHNICGNQFKKNVQKFFDSPIVCSYCKTASKTTTLSIKDAKTMVDKKFNSQIDILTYRGYHEKCTYKCLQCGQIFIQKFDRLLGSKGCPKCNKKSS